MAIAHALHATGDKGVLISGADRLRRQHDRFETGTTDFIDGKCGQIVGQTGEDSRLPRRSLTDTGGDDVAHDDFFDCVRARYLNGAPLL